MTRRLSATQGDPGFRLAVFGGFSFARLLTSQVGARDLAVSSLVRPDLFPALEKHVRCLAKYSAEDLDTDARDRCRTQASFPPLLLDDTGTERLIALTESAVVLARIKTDPPPAASQVGWLKDVVPKGLLPETARADDAIDWIGPGAKHAWLPSPTGDEEAAAADLARFVLLRWCRLAEAMPDPEVLDRRLWEEFDGGFAACAARNETSTEGGLR